MPHRHDRNEAWQAPIPHLVRPDIDPLPEPGRFATIHRGRRIIVDGCADLGPPPIALVDATLVYRPGADCGSELHCFRRLRLLVPEGRATHSGALSGPGVVLLFANADGGLTLTRPLALAAGLEVVHGSVSLSDSPRTPVSSQGGMGQGLGLGDAGRLAALDLGSRLYLEGASAGCAHATILGDLTIRANGAFAPSFATPAADGVARAVDSLHVGGRLTLDTGARLVLPSEMADCELPGVGLPLITARTHGAVTLTVYPDPMRFRTEWRGDTLFLCPRAACA
jgi:hypothetical protein